MRVWREGLEGKDVRYMMVYDIKVNGDNVRCDMVNCDGVRCDGVKCDGVGMVVG